MGVFKQILLAVALENRADNGSGPHYGKAVTRHFALVVISLASFFGIMGTLINRSE